MENMCVQSWNALQLRIAACPQRQSGNPPAPLRNIRLWVNVCVSECLSLLRTDLTRYRCVSQK